MRIERQILRSLKMGPKSFWELNNNQDAHVVEFLETIKKLLSQNIIGYDGKKFFLLKEVDVEPYKETKCSICGIGVEIKGYFEDIYREFLKATEKRPLPTSKYNQGFIRPIDTIRRLAFMYERGDVEGMDIFILGDDDLLSVAIGLTGMARSITVVEIDERINRFIQEFAESRNIKNIKVKRYNVIEELPEEAKRNFDVFVTDPVETKEGFLFFVGRCLEALKGKGSVGYIGLTYIEASLNKWWQFQKFLIDSNMVITDILRDFMYYPENENQWNHFYETYEVMKQFELPIPDVDWYRSCFLRLEAIDTPNLQNFNIEKPKSEEDIYFDEESWATPKPTIDREDLII
ncbi:MAG: bis-aminopropyl spermidine synthase family protein [Thermosulfidibacteraceae bacterium]